jgi:hypothetical protein
LLTKHCVRFHKLEFLEGKRRLGCSDAGLAREHSVARSTTNARSIMIWHDDDSTGGDKIYMVFLQHLKGSVRANMTAKHPMI